MSAFTCPECHHYVVFESLRCLHSRTELAFSWTTRSMLALTGEAPCANREPEGCNGLAGPSGYCFSCALTRVRPNRRDRLGVARLVRAEKAKRRLLFTLLEIGLSVDGDDKSADRGLQFDLLSSDHQQGENRPRRWGDHDRPC